MKYIVTVELGSSYIETNYFSTKKFDRIESLRLESFDCHDAPRLISVPTDHFVNFKVEITMNPGLIIEQIFFADTLEQLEKQVLKEFPKGKIILVEYSKGII